MKTKIAGELAFGCITEKSFELQGAFPVRLMIPCDDELLNYLKNNNYWAYPTSDRSKIFGRQEANCVISNIESEEHGRFLVQCLSFLYGQKLFTRPCEYIESVRLKRDCFGLGLNNESIKNGLIYCNKKWNEISSFPDKNEQLKMKKRLFGIIHLLFMSYSDKALQFEKFMYLYIAIDACFRHLVKIGNIKDDNIKYAKRIDKIFEVSGIGFSTAINKINFISIRTDLFHEGLFLDEPLGYRAKGGSFNITFIQNYLVRLIFYIFCINAVGFLPSVDFLDQQSITVL